MDSFAPRFTPDQHTPQQNKLWGERLALEKRAEVCHAARVRVYRGQGPRNDRPTSILPPPPIPFDPNRPFEPSPVKRLAHARALEGKIMAPASRVTTVGVNTIRDLQPPEVPKLPAWHRPASAKESRDPRRSRVDPLTVTSAASGARSRGSSSSTRVVLERRMEAMGAQLSSQNRMMENFQAEIQSMNKLIAALLVAKAPGASK